MIKIFFDKIPVIPILDDIDILFREMVADIQKEYTSQKAIEIDSMIFDLYDLSPEERETIGFVEIQWYNLIYNPFLLMTNRTLKILYG